MSDSSRKFVSCWVKDTLIGIDIADVREISKVSSVTPVQSVQPTVHGVINLRGSLVTLLDLRYLLRGEPTEDARASINIIVEIDGEFFGLLADKLSDVVTATAEQIQPVPSLTDGRLSRYLGGVVELPSQLLAVFEPVRLLEAHAPGYVATEGAPARGSE